jgi:hypothetical protein
MERVVAADRAFILLAVCVYLEEIVEPIQVLPVGCCKSAAAPSPEGNL